MNWYLGVLKKYAVFDGRAQRAEYWYFVLFNTIVSFILGFIDGILGTFNVLSGIYLLAVFIPSIAVGARRLHDIGKSGCCQLIAIIPIIGPILLIIWFATDSKADNQYGVNPKGTNKPSNIINNDSIEQLEKLADLKEKGIITEEEFNSKKQELLG